MSHKPIEPFMIADCPKCGKWLRPCPTFGDSPGFAGFFPCACDRIERSVDDAWERNRGSKTCAERKEGE